MVLVLHVTSIADVLVDEGGALLYVGVTPSSQVAMGILEVLEITLQVIGLVDETTSGYVVVAREVERARSVIQKQASEHIRREKTKRATSRAASGRKNKATKKPAPIASGNMGVSFFSRAPTPEHVQSAPTLPWPFAAVNVLVSFAACIFVMVRLEQLQCPSGDLFWSQTCASQSYPIFSSSPPECPCQTLMPRPGSEYPGCASPQGAGKLNDYFEHEDAPANIKYIFLYKCRLLKNTTLDMITSKLTNLRVLELNAITTPATLAGEANYLSPQLGRLSLLVSLACIRASLVEVPTSISALSQLRGLHLEKNITKGWDALANFNGNDNRWNRIPAILANKWRTFRSLGLMYNNISSHMPGFGNQGGDGGRGIFLRGNPFCETQPRVSYHPDSKINDPCGECPGGAMASMPVPEDERGRVLVYAMAKSTLINNTTRVRCN
eukprot:g3236.t1